ncbi:DNA-binding protein [Salimicrobium jeotgali]|uniref:DNA-binding protein n=1 Tax=Salimicrobium jeotgali TaxID=1230341 RepID=K2H8T1_9BACI|nr:small multi-drug export protein [Salimicrobium jeotgali]AKG03564.1 DNA-binding protein [Salimicrobium jeotgali]EKE32055.1 putative small multidrug efflux protein [Salimicrobium jeotgali]MBM7696022.1 putative membrane protein [Salimicrobium jeotgali]
MLLYKYLLIFLGAATPWLEVLVVVPLGIVWGLSPILVMVVGFMGNMLTVIPVILLFDKLKAWYVRRREEKGRSSSRSVRAVRLFQKYGVIGFALLGPILIGTHIAAFIGMAMGATKRRMLTWMGISIALWVLIVGLLTAFGFDFFVQDTKAAHY